MSSPANEDRADHIKQQTARLRRRMTDLASSIAATEEQVADTLDEVARYRSAPDAERLHAEADQARRYAANERDRTMNYED